MFLHHVSRRTGKSSSSLIWSYWLVQSIFYFPIYYRVFVDTFLFDGVDPTTFTMTSIIYPFIFASFLLNSFSESIQPPRRHEKRKPPKPSPGLTASPLSSLVFEWMTSLIFKGYQKFILLDDLYDPHPKLKSTANYRLWVKNWEKELTESGYNSRDGSYNQKRQPSLLWSILKTFWPVFVSTSFIIVIRTIAKPVPALMLDAIASYVTNKQEPLWHGLLYAGIIFVTSTINSFCYRHSDYMLAFLGMRIRGLMMSAIYQKALRISSKSQGKYTVGELVNLVSVDADKVYRLCVTSSSLVASPMSVFITIYLLWQYLGPACLAGVAVIFVMMPISGVLAQRNRRLQESQMKLKDTRMKMMNEILNSMKILKLFAWEPAFFKRVEDVRDEEVSMLKLYAYISAGVGFFWTCTPFLVCLTSFTVFVLSSDQNVLTPTIAFVSLTLFNMIRFSMVIIPDFISNAIQTSVSFNRIREFLLADEMNPRVVGNAVDEGDAISMRNVSASWIEGDPKVIEEIDFHAKRGKLVAIVGPVGSGKSSMLSAILGDLTITGTVDVSGSVAYVPQQAWIQNQTIRDNIVFTGDFERRRYDKVVKAACLGPDLDILEGGDLTEIGEKGINLSGGQRQRVSLARAAYQNRDVYLFDDPLSAVDAHVSKSLFKELIGPKGMLRKKTRVLVTNNLSVINEVDFIFVLSQGRIVEQGTYPELMDRKGVLQELLAEHLGAMEQSDVQDLKEKLSGEKQESKDRDIGSSDFSRHRVQSLASIASLGLGEQAEPAPPEDSKFNLVTKETIEEGSVKLQIYINYFKHIGAPLIIATLFFYIAFRSLDVVSGLWLSAWSQDPDTSPENRNNRLMVYAGLGLVQAISNFLGVAFLTKSTVTAATRLHELILRSVMKAPMSFFDKTPMGRLLNRFGKDLDQLDVQLPLMANFFLEMLFQIVGVITLISMKIPVFVAIAVPVMALFISLRQIFVRSLRQLKRLESVTRSPIYSNFSESLQGISSIRAYKVGNVFQRLNDDRVDVSQNCSYHIQVCNYWLSIRLEFLGNILILAMAVFVVVNREFDAGTAGLLISYGLNSVVAFNFFVYFSTEVESTIIAAERLDEYTNIEPEAEWKTGAVRTTWPEDGRIEFEDYSTRYREGSELVLREVDLLVDSAQKVGVVGRTGAGKSSLILSIFRIIEAVRGKIEIDGVDIAEVGLHELRSKLTIIPQESVLFNATLRFNLDPNDEYGDEELWRALENSHLKRFFEAMNGLQTPITEGGGNLSAGQRQLVCLARAILRKTKILVLDEATAAVDLDTDALIQQAIRNDFKETTILTIAHRLNTILDSDIVVVMAEGRVIESGTPAELLEDPESQFADMAREAGITADSLPAR